MPSWIRILSDPCNANIRTLDTKTKDPIPETWDSETLCVAIQNHKAQKNITCGLHKKRSLSNAHFGLRAEPIQTRLVLRPLVHKRAILQLSMSHPLLPTSAKPHTDSQHDSPTIRTTARNTHQTTINQATTETVQSKLKTKQNHLHTWELLGVHRSRWDTLEADSHPGRTAPHMPCTSALALPGPCPSLRNPPRALSHDNSQLHNITQTLYKDGPTVHIICLVINLPHVHLRAHTWHLSLTSPYMTSWECWKFTVHGKGVSQGMLPWSVHKPTSL